MKTYNMKTGALVLLGIWLLAIQNLMAADWQIVASPNGTKAVNELHGVSAVSDNDVWTVGASYDTERLTALTLIEHWNGTQWSIVPSPNPSSTVNTLNAVAAVSANDVWAVGTAPTGSATVLIIHWNGIAWSVVPNPNSSMPLSNLAALAVISANDLWAVGTGAVSDEAGTATLHWNGTAWSVISSPNVTPEVDNSLAGVAAVASNDIWAVGTQQPTNLTDPSTLILHWNGLAWSIVPSVSPEGGHLLAAAAVTSNDVWATGYSELGTLSEHWDGSSWSIVPTPGIPHSEPLFLFSVVALASNDVWSVGEFFQTRRSLSRTLTEQWNGTQWNVVRSPNQGSDHNELFGLSATPSETLWAVGTAYQYPKQKSLILRKLP